MAPRHRQRGWLGFVVILLALVVVAVVARTALKEYGVGGEAKPPARAGANETEQAAAVTPRNALERARGVEAMVKDGAAKQQQSIDDAIVT